MNYKIDLTGRKYGRLSVLSYAGQKGRRRTMWKCRCDCGNIVEVESTHLRTEHTKSCGCISKENISKLNYKNGLSNSRLNTAYRNMLNRCYREKDSMYDLYGGRGIIVCDEWLPRNNGFVNFCEWAISHGYSEHLTLDRIDNEKGYFPDNCRWVDKYQQANNKRNNYYLNINGKIDTVGNWARKLNISYWNLLHYAKGGCNCKYPELNIQAVTTNEL